MKPRSIPLIPSFCSSVVATLAMTMLLLESEKLLYLPDPCLYCRISTGRHLSWNRESARGLLSLCVAMLRRAGAKITAFNLLSPPRHISGKRNDDCIVESSIIHSPAAAAASASPCGDFGQLHMHGKGAPGK
jgi:hypothetical protein